MTISRSQDQSEKEATRRTQGYATRVKDHPAQVKPRLLPMIVSQPAQYLYSDMKRRHPQLATQGS